MKRRKKSHSPAPNLTAAIPQRAENLADQSDNTEASNLLSETCFRLESHGSVVELHVAGQLVNTDDNTGEVGEVNVSQEEGNLNSLWYDDKNAQWKTEISDEEANRLHVIIKPRLENWAKLTSNVSSYQTRQSIYRQLV